MDEVNPLPVIWTENALEDSLVIKSYLAYKFSQKEIDNFYKMLSAFENVVRIFPQLYQINIKNRQVRRAVLSKQLSVFYIHAEQQITVVSILDNRMDDALWP